MVCRWCGKDPLEQRGHKPRLFCNASCRNKAWQKKRAERLRQEQEGTLLEAQAALVTVEHAVRTLRLALGGKVI